ncbi:MAG: DUF4367 domain-containing protein [Clostridia bacterium]|nr:DUF4367 domain-containing protein [Clostridia bacterium]
MAGERHSQLLDELLKQNLTAEEITKRLSAIIDREIELPDGQRDQELIDACVDLQWYLATGEHYVSNRAGAKARLDAMIGAEENGAAKRRGRRMTVRVAAAVCCAAALLFLPIAGRGLFGGERIEGTTVDGGEVYQLNGVAVEAKKLDAAIADAEADAEDLSITTTDYAMISKLPGVAEMHLGYVPEGWKNDYYRYVRTANVVHYLECYSLDNTDKILKLECTVYPDAKSIIDGIEQNESGEILTIEGKSVYFAQNYNLSIATWSEGLTNYLISGPLTQQEFIQMIESVGGV